MGYSSYSAESRSFRAASEGYTTVNDSNLHTVFKTNRSNYHQSSMLPKGLTVRESRDSEAHPNSVAIIIALDVTGSMMSVPAEMVKEGLPTVMTTIIQAGQPDPQVMFLGIGDHECDRAPLQVGQFESGDEELDKWLTETWLEKGGGGNTGESYMLAWYMAAKHTSIDCWDKRKQKGILFTIGDEPVLPRISSLDLMQIFGDGQYSNYTSKELLEEAQKTYEVFHIHTTETGAGRRYGVQDGWKELMGQNLIVVDHHSKIPQVIAETVCNLTITASGSTEGVSQEDVIMPDNSDSTDDVTML